MAPGVGVNHFFIFSFCSPVPAQVTLDAKGWWGVQLFSFIGRVLLPEAWECRKEPLFNNLKLGLLETHR
jgi:hypothetical protein